MDKKKLPLYDLFLHEKPVKILVALKSSGENCYASTLAKVADCTYSHTVKILEIFKKRKLVVFEKKGRVKYIKLTEFGDELATDFREIIKKFSSNSNADLKC